MSNRISYRADVEMGLITGKGEFINIAPYYINSIITDYDFENNFMPVIYVQLNISLELYDKLVLENTDGKIYLNIKKYDAKSTNSMKHNDIKDQFIYFLPTDANYTKKLEIKNLDRNSETKYLLMGLLKIELMNLNKTSFNGTFLNTDSITMMNLFLSDLKSKVMDEIEINTKYEKLVVPPKNSRSDAIKFLFELNPFYKTKYNLFYDFVTTYLTNRSGNPVNKKGLNTVLFKINQISEMNAYIDGIEKDVAQGVYIINANVSDTNTVVNTTTEKDINQLVGASTDNVTITDLYINPAKDNTNKQLFIREKEMGTLVTKNELDNTSVTVSIAKKNIDGSIITPDKSYIIKNYDNYKKYNGKFLLMRKKEFLIRDDMSFTPILQVELRRISDQD